MKFILKKYRDYYNLSQKDLEELTGINQSTISRIERGKQEPTTEQLENLAEVFEIYVEDLYVKESILDKIKNVFK